MERFKISIFKQREDINDRMTEVFGLLKELTTNRAPEKVLISEEARHLITKNVNSISLIRGEEEKNANDKATSDDSIERPDGSDEEVKEEESVEAPNSQPVGYYLKHRINEKLIEGLVENHRGPVYEAILKKKITKRRTLEEILKYPKLTDERSAETDIRLSLASHSYIYPLGIAEDVLVDVVGYMYPVDFVILDIKEDENRPFILGTPFLTTAKAVIKFDKGTITLRSGKSKMSFHRIPESLCKIEKGIKNDIEPISLLLDVNRCLEWRK
ncbi:MAK10-like protein [Tanacetum coccineum]